MIFSGEKSPSIIGVQPPNRSYDIALVFFFYSFMLVFNKTKDNINTK